VYHYAAGVQVTTTPNLAAKPLSGSKDLWEVLPVDLRSGAGAGAGEVGCVKMHRKL